jgi:transcriptional regulator with PAS, ATPase and Fis domain
MVATRDRARRYAAVDSPVLILGETGTGKRLLARMIHETSARRAGPFLEVGCSARPEALLDVEIFGDTGGEGVGGGVFDRAHRGTVLLKNVGDLPPGLQTKLLRFIDDGEVWPIGAGEPRRPDVRVLVASSRDLGWMVTEEAFRADLYYRLNVLTLVMPPLRERREDIAPLVEMMLARLARTHGRARMMAPAAMEVLARCPFPGNVRELGSLVERLLVWTRSGVIDVPDLPSELAVRTPEGSATGKRLTMRKMLRDIEAQMVRDALARYGTQTEAAKHLGVTQSTVARKAKQYGLGRR